MLTADPMPSPALPFEILSRIFLLLPPRFLFWTLPLVCRSWKQAADYSADRNGRIPLELNIRSPVLGKPLQEPCRVRNSREGQIELMLWDEWRRVGGNARVLVAGVVFLELSLEFLATSEPADVEIAIRKAVVQRLTTDRVKLVLSGAHLDEYEIPDEESAVTSIDVVQKFLDFMRHSGPFSVNVDGTLLEHKQLSHANQQFPSITSITYNDTPSGPAFDAALTNIFNTFPNLTRLSYYGFRLFFHLPADLRTCPEMTRLTSIQYWYREAQAENPNLSAHIFFIPSLCSGVTDFGRPLLFPEMWRKISNQAANTPFNGIDPLAGLARLHTFWCCVSFRPALARSFISSPALMEHVVEGIARYMPNLRVIMVQPLRLYEILPPETLQELERTWDHFVRVVPAKKIVWVGSYAGRCPAPNMAILFDAVRNSCKRWGKQFGALKWGDMYSMSIIAEDLFSI
ncbi:hypothetical protein M427DRAFT_59601 [Gonapodya prolifera JEL478]|uniref:F-box domain-containing protein n=1 Tax=Gonapodya prolifera (strain JEL478) TaxID=1344416 RepID=A0A139A6L6_GONPJ|nr:hypothetical protein M427DRAFT_59601 [Gonapodya prolifera JEL478]|eukprot:KXS12457.1 hypothetical protein M427DRAFT_59601 [Gonapodya prolifera JEL478]